MAATNSGKQISISDRILQGIAELKNALGSIPKTGSPQESTEGEAPDQSSVALHNAAETLRQAQEDINTATAAQSAAESNLEAATLDLTNLRAEMDAAKTTIAQLQEDAKTASDQAVDIVAAQGIDTSSIKSQQKDGESTALNEWRAMNAAGKTQEAAKFYAANKESILR